MYTSTISIVRSGAYKDALLNDLNGAATSLTKSKDEAAKTLAKDDAEALEKWTQASWHFMGR